MNYLGILYSIGTIIVLVLLMLSAQENDMTFIGILKLIVLSLIWPIVTIPVIAVLSILIAIMSTFFMVVLPFLVVAVIYLVFGEYLFKTKGA